MNPNQKEVSYRSTNTYTTLNELTAKTKNVWFVCHGIGYLSRYFLKYFDELDHDENYIIAPQAPSKYYLGSAYKHVGSSWLTKENTATEIENVLNYFDSIFEAERLPATLNLIALGYSQGVSVAMRYVAKRKLKCNELILIAGGIPNELISEDFKFLDGEAKVSLLYGNQDEYLNTSRLLETKKHFYDLFGSEAVITCFEGKHEMPTELLKNFVS